jgi:hypothetical protein
MLLPPGGAVKGQPDIPDASDAEASGPPWPLGHRTAMLFI